MNITRVNYERPAAAARPKNILVSVVGSPCLLCSHAKDSTAHSFTAQAGADIQSVAESAFEG